MTQTLRAACIGLQHGHSRGLIETFKILEGVEVAAFCDDTDADALEKLKADHPDADCFSSLDDLLANCEFDLACLTLPANEAPVAGRKLALAGKHFLHEKSLTRKAEDMLPMLEAVRENNIKVLAYYPWRGHPAIRGLKELLDDGTLGRPLALHAQLITTQVREGLRSPKNIAYRDDTEGGGLLHMEGGHWLEAMRFLLGCEVSAVTALCRPVVGNMPGENMDDVSAVGLEFENGVVGNLHMGYLQAVSGSKDYGLQFWGTEGSAKWYPMGSATLQVTSRAWGEPVNREIEFELPERPGVYGGKQWMVDLVQDLVQAIHEDREPAITAVDGYRTHQVIDCAYESSRTGRRVEVTYSA